MSAPRPSARLLRAAAAERAELARHRARLVDERDELQAALARVERGLAEIDERRALLDRLAPAEPGGMAPRRDAAGAPAGGAPGGGAAGAPGTGAAGAPAGGAALADAELLHGPAIRETAVRLLVQRGGEALHYREWFRLLTEAGHAIAGKDPLAVFLTQLSRSPAVRRGTRAGVYELDRHAAGRLRAALDSLQRELRELTAPAGAAADLAAIRARRSQLTSEISRLERALEEIGRVLEPPPALAAAAG